MLGIRKINSMVRRIGTMGAAVALIGGFAFAQTGVVSAQAGDGEYFSTSGHYLNDWNSGAEVNVYNGQTLNDSFDPEPASNPNYVNLVYTNNGSYKGYCIGDYGDNVSNPDTGMVGGCGTSSVGWGGNMELRTSGCSTGFGIYDIHWAAWVAPSGSSNGDPFKLNQSEVCFNNV
jgi:hypothetical protein